MTRKFLFLITCFAAGAAGMWVLLVSLEPLPVPQSTTSPPIPEIIVITPPAEPTEHQEVTWGEFNDTAQRLEKIERELDVLEGVIDEIGEVK